MFSNLSNCPSWTFVNIGFNFSFSNWILLLILVKNHISFAFTLCLSVRLTIYVYFICRNMRFTIFLITLIWCYCSSNQECCLNLVNSFYPLLILIFISFCNLLFSAITVPKNLISSVYYILCPFILKSRLPLFYSLSPISSSVYLFSY